MRFAAAAMPMAVLICTSVALAQTPPAPRPLKYAISSRPMPLPPWRVPHRPQWKLSELLGAHAGQQSWSQTLVEDKNYKARYIQMAPGEKTTPLMYAETEMFWVVQAGQMNVRIEGLDPFIAGKGFLIQVPARTVFSMEAVGDVPSLRFEVIHAGALPVYPVEETPAPVKGQTYIKVAYPLPVTKLDPAKIYVDFNRQVIQGNESPGRFLKAGSLIRGMTTPMPPDSDQGHFHIDANEFWFIMEGQMAYQIEGAPKFTAEQGDVMYAPQGRFHRNSFAGGGMATRLAIFPLNAMNNLDAENPSRQSP